jgi:hypothetical protein
LFDNRVQRRNLEEAYEAGLFHSGEPVFVDFDYTLFACNSTELFIANCRPSLVVSVAEFLFRKCLPWRLLPVKHWFRVRDYLFCLALITLLPWTLAAWKRKAPALFATYISHDLDEVLKRAAMDRPVIVTFGMEVIVRALLCGGPWSEATLVATPLRVSPSYLSKGKLALLLSKYDEITVASSTIVTDSEDDLDVLNFARNGILISPRGEPFNAQDHLYLPMRYTFAAKYPTLFLMDQIFLVDILLGVICSSRDIRDGVIALICVPFFYFSFMCIYEIGYYENDMLAASRESRPTLTKDAYRFASYRIQPDAWIWSALLSLVGLSLASALGAVPRSTLANSAAAWAALIVLSRVVFFAYNRQKVEQRIYLYLVLQLAKYGGIFLMFRLTLPGFALLASQVLQMWIVYLVYRLGGKRSPLDKEWLRFGLFGTMVALLTLVAPATMSMTPFSIVLPVVWLVLRLVKQPLMKRFRSRSAEAAGAIG